jgi:ketosteroid isomerase-like protein
MATTAANIARIRALYTTWAETRGDCPDDLAGIFADNVRLASMDDSQPGLAFAKASATRADAVRYFSGILNEWEMVHHTPDEVFGDGDRVAMFGSCGWRNKRTGKIADCRIANLWRFEDGKVVEFIDVFDSARAAEAATPDKPAPLPRDPKR